MHRLRDSVRVRLTATVTVIFGLALVLAALGLVRQVENTLVDDLKARNEAVATAVGRQIAAQGGQVSISESALVDARNSSPEELEVIQQGINESYVFVEGPGSMAVNEPASFFERLRRAMTGEAVPLFGKTLPARVDTQQYAVNRLRVSTAQGDVVLSVASSLTPIRRTVDRVSGALLFAVPSLVIGVGLLAWFMTGRTLRPVSAITGRVQEITASSLDQRVPVPDTDDEIGELARTMNSMLDRLQSAADTQRRFVSDASHELRSPVAAIRAQVETALLHPDRADWPEIGRTVLAEDERLAGLVDDLLRLARLDEGAVRARSEVDLDELVHAEVSRPRRVLVDRSGVVAGRVVGVPDELTSVVRNLLDNAVRHASERVRVSLHTDGPVVRLVVEDDGPGVAEADREKIFERFARLQAARSRDAGGSGLGLALAHRVVVGHGGRIWVETSDLGGARFVVELPAVIDDGDDPDADLV